MTTSEQSFDAIEQETYKRQLLHQYKTKSTYAELWLHVKYALKVTHPLKPAIAYSQYNAVRRGIARLATSDNYFKEFCRLHYGREIELHTKYLEYDCAMLIWLDTGVGLTLE